MAKAKRTKTRYPGINRVGQRYEWRTWRGGPSGTCDTIEQARQAKAKAETNRSGHRRSGAGGQATFGGYARAWVIGYQGRTRRGLDEGTREGYRRDLERYAIPYFDGVHRRRLDEIEPRDVRAFAVWLGQQKHPRTKKPISQTTVTKVIAPVKAMFACAVEDGDLTQDPAAKVRVTVAERVDPDRDLSLKHRALTSAEYGRFLAVLPSEMWRLFFEVLLQTGLRFGEVIELRGKDIATDAAGKPVLRVRRAHSDKPTRDAAGEPQKRGRVKPTKSQHGRREIPLSPTLARSLWRLQRAPGELLFQSEAGTRLIYGNVHRRILKPAARAAGVSWVGFHTFRRSCATVLLARGKTPKQIQEWIGHHSSGYTMDAYVRLDETGLGSADVFEGFGQAPEPGAPASDDAAVDADTGA